MIVTTQRCRGFTLFECILYCMLFALVAVGTMHVVGDARVIRSNARDRTRLALIAQSELERLRTAPATERAAGVKELTNPAWPLGTKLQVELKHAEGGTWSVDIQARRDSIEGKPTVRLASVLVGAQP